jgi:hypothetical protein
MATGRRRTSRRGPRRRKSRGRCDKNAPTAIRENARADTRARTRVEPRRPRVYHAMMLPRRDDDSAECAEARVSVGGPSASRGARHPGGYMCRVPVSTARSFLPPSLSPPHPLLVLRRVLSSIRHGTPPPPPPPPPLLPLSPPPPRPPRIVGIIILSRGESTCPSIGWYLLSSLSTD